MDVKLLTPFLDGMKALLEQFNVTDIKRGRLERKANLNTASDVTVIIGFQKDLRGNVAYSMSNQTALNLVSLMMGSVPMNEQNIESAICEFVNMMSGYTVSSFYKMNLKIENTPPTMISGKKLFLMISRVETIMLEIITPLGPVEVNIGIEQ